MTLLSVNNLSVRFGDVDAVNDVSFTLDKGETLALVGESGSGKSVTALSVLKLLPYPAASHPSGSIHFDGAEILGADERTVRAIRGNRVSMIFQEPMSALNPLHTIGKQIAEPLELHRGLTGKQALSRVKELLDLVELESLLGRLDAYPHQLSGGQRQRVMIAMALANEPELLIADEPTTALDVTVQVEILKLLRSLQQRLGMAMLFITHDLTLVRRMAHQVAVMRRGAIVEMGETDAVFSSPKHDYTKQLMEAEPKGEAVDKLESRAPIGNLLSCSHLSVHFPVKKNFWGKSVAFTKAVDDVSITIPAGQTLGIVGESGSGKTTLGLGLLRLLRSQGDITFDQTRLDVLSTRDLRPLRRRMQLVFQDPFSSLNPRMTIGQIVGEGLAVHGDLSCSVRSTDLSPPNTLPPTLFELRATDRATKGRGLLTALTVPKENDEYENAIDTVLTDVGLEPAMKHRYPHEFSGGQRQRISIARAVVLRPEFIVLDEPTSALDLLIQAQIIDLLRDLQKRYGLTYMFISHDLRVIRAISHSVAVMKDGKIVETGPTAEIFDTPKQAYTKTLIEAAFAHSLT